MLELFLPPQVQCVKGLNQAMRHVDHSKRRILAASSLAAPSYGERLSQEPRWALSEASAFFEGKSRVQDTLRRITGRLDKMGIPYAVSGGLALFVHGYRRFTEDVDLLVTPEGLRTIHEKLEGLGYVAPFRGSKNLKDTESGVKVEFLVTGQFPGDGKPKPVAFPDPAGVAVEKEGIKYLGLPTLVELKLASGMTNPGRLRDLADVMELIRALHLSKEFGGQLAPFVWDKFLELWRMQEESGFTDNGDKQP